MNTAVRRSGTHEGAPNFMSGNAVTRVELFDDFAAAEPLWRGLKSTAPLATPYQRFEWISRWYTHVGKPSGAELLLVAGIDCHDAPALVAAFVVERCLGCRIARYCGGRHANLNMPMVRRDVAAELTPTRTAELLNSIAKARQIDLFALLGQPPVWRGVDNPFAALPHRLSPDDVHNGTIDPHDPSTLPKLPSGMRKKKRKLMKLDGFHYCVAKTSTDVDRILGAFWPQKAERFQRQGIRNVFADPGVKSFIRAACLDGLDKGRPAIELHALEGGGEVLAIVGGVDDGKHFSVMFNSITSSDQARQSPGIILMTEIIADCTRRGVKSFDLGAGLAPYKAYFCSGSEGRRDVFIPFSLRGRIAATACSTIDGMHRAFKTNALLMKVLQGVRRLTTAGHHAA